MGGWQSLLPCRNQHLFKTGYTHWQQVSRFFSLSFSHHWHLPYLHTYLQQQITRSQALWYIYRCGSFFCTFCCVSLAFQFHERHLWSPAVWSLWANNLKDYCPHLSHTPARQTQAGTVSTVSIYLFLDCSFSCFTTVPTHLTCHPCM